MSYVLKLSLVVVRCRDSVCVCVYVLSCILSQVHLKFRMNPEALYLTISIVDRFLERKIIDRNSLQLLGIAGMSGI